MSKELKPCVNDMCIKNCRSVESGCLLDYTNKAGILQACEIYTTKKPENIYKKMWDKLIDNIDLILINTRDFKDTEYYSRLMAEMQEIEKELINERKKRTRK